MLAIYVPAFFHILRLLDSIELSYKAFLYTGFVHLCMWDWSDIPMILMYFAGSMLMGTVFLDLSLNKRWQKVLTGAAVGVYSLLFVPLLIYNRYADTLLQAGLIWIVAVLLPVLAISMLYIRPLRYVICALHGGMLVWGMVICIVNYTKGAWAFGFMAACMLIPSILLLRNWLCPNSRIASILSIGVYGWSVYIFAMSFIKYLSPKTFSLYYWVDMIVMVVLILSLICLIIDTVLVFRSHRGQGIPAAPGDPPAPAEE